MEWSMLYSARNYREEKPPIIPGTCPSFNPFPTEAISIARSGKLGMGRATPWTACVSLQKYNVPILTIRHAMSTSTQRI